MSNEFFPVLPGLKWGRVKTPVWSTRIQTAVSGREWRAANYSYPLWHFKLTYEFLRAGAQEELQSLIGFFNARKGSFESFLYRDPYDHAVEGQLLGVGDGETVEFQLIRETGDFIEPVTALASDVTLFVDSVEVDDDTYLVSDSGLITFEAPPGEGDSLSWTGSFNFRCRFLQDMIDFENFLYNLWKAQKVEFTSIK